MLDPETTKRVRAMIEQEAEFPKEPGPRPWQRPLHEIFGTAEQQSCGAQMVQHVRKARCVADLEPTLCVYSYNPPVGFHFTITDPISRCAVEIWPHHATDQLWAELRLVQDRDRWSQPPDGRNHDPEEPLLVGGEGDGYYIIREVPIQELLDLIATLPSVYVYGDEDA